MKITKSFQTIDFGKINEYEKLRKCNWVGYAEFYLDRCYYESKTSDKVDRVVYNKLAKLDARLGTTPSEQLFGCLRKTTRWDIIKVRIHYLNENYNIISDYRF